MSRRSRPWATLLVAGVALSAFVIPGAPILLELDRSRLASGELWRLVTGHLAHFGGRHLAYDLAALGLLGWICEPRWPSRTRWALALAAPAIAVAVLALDPDVVRYRGLSGLASCLFVLLCVRTVREAAGGQVLAAIALAGFALKVAVELTTTTPLFVGGDRFAVVPVAHLAGALVGAISALLAPHLDRAAPCTAPSCS